MISTSQLSLCKTGLSVVEIKVAPCRGKIFEKAPGNISHNQYNHTSLSIHTRM